MEKLCNEQQCTPPQLPVVARKERNNHRKVQADIISISGSKSLNSYSRRGTQASQPVSLHQGALLRGGCHEASATFVSWVFAYQLGFICLTWQHFEELLPVHLGSLTG